MDLLFVLALLAIAASLGSLVARGFAPRRWPLPAVLAVLVGLFGHITETAWALGLAIALTVGGVIGPAWLASFARRRAMRGDFAGAARFAGALARLQPQWHGWRALWHAADRWYAGDPEPARALASRLAADHHPLSRVQREALMGLTRDWAAARFAVSVDLQSRALCELGALDAGIETAARAWAPRMRWVAIRRARGTALAPLAFAGRLGATEQLTAQLGLPPAARSIWHATASAAGGDRADAERRLTAVLGERRLPAAVRVAAEARRAELPQPVAIGDAARAVLDDLAGEIAAGDFLRTRPVRTSPVSLAILTLMAIGYGLQLAAGSATEGRVALELGALYAEGRFPDEPWRLLAYAGLHAGPLHLAANALAVVVLGPMVERTLGPLWACIVFAGGVLIGGLGISYLGAEGITVGASAGAMALLGGLVVATLLHPDIRQTRTGRAAARLGVVLIVLQSVLDGLTPMISSAGHICGGLAGLALGALALAGRPQAGR